MSANYFTYDAKNPVGKITLFSEGDFITGLYFRNTQKENVVEGKTSAIENAISQLEEYFSGRRKIFDIKIKFYGTDFQKSVWERLLLIPYGETKTYGQIAAEIGNPKSSRAVGMANNKNPISIIAPCHRVIGANGALVGYGGGLDTKRFLLGLEGADGG